MEIYHNTLTIKANNKNDLLSFKKQQKLKQVCLYLNNIKDFEKYISDNETSIPIENKEHEEIAHEIKISSNHPINGSLESVLENGRLQVSWKSVSNFNCSLWFVIVLSKQFPEFIFEYPIRSYDQTVDMKIRNAILLSFTESKELN